MVLSFINKITIKGGSAELRNRCESDLEQYARYRRAEAGPTEVYDTYSRLELVSNHYPLDNALINIATQYLALDFILEFRPKSEALLKDWSGCIKVTDLNVYFSDNYEASEGYDLGSVFILNYKGGFPDCLSGFQ